MSSKRSLSQKSGSDVKSQSKKLKTFDFNNYFHKCLQESGISLKHPPEKCISSQETVHIIRNIKKNLEKHFDYPRNVSEFYLNLEKECQDIDIFKHYLFPNVVRITGDSPEEHQLSDSVMKLLLSVPILQNKLIDFIFEKAIDLAAQSKCSPWIQMILKCFSTLDNIANSEKMSSNLINLLDVSSEKIVKLEIITAIPDIIGDQEHSNISEEMSRILSEDQDLIPAILDCLSYLCLSEEQYELLQKKTLNILATLSKCSYFPNFVKFLLMPVHSNDASYLEVVQGLRNALAWPQSQAKPEDIASSQVLTATTIRHSMISSKNIANAWLKVVTNCKIYTEHKPIDFIILLILYSTSEERQKQVENAIRKQIKSETLKEELLNETFEKFKPILKNNLKSLIEINNVLLKSKNDPLVESFATHMYTLMLSQLEDCCPTILAELLQLGLDSKQCVMNILQILNNVATKDMSLLKPQSIQMLTLLDRMDDVPLGEVKAIMNLLCGLAYSYENSVIRDDIHMIIRKELGSSNPTTKVQGILAGIHAVKYLMVKNFTDDETREMPDDVSYSSVTHLPEGDLREAAQIIELISRSTRQFPDMVAFFYDELSIIISSTSHINKNFLSWLTDAVTNDLQQNFIVDCIETDKIGDIKLSMQYCLNADSEMDEIIAINIAGLTLQSSPEVYVGILSPLFQLVQILHNKQHDCDLSSIDALLGCPVVMPLFDVDLIEDMDQNNISNILDCLIHCANWFRELLNAFANQDDEALQSKILKRLLQVEHLENLIGKILFNTRILYKPPTCSFNINKYMKEQFEKKVTKVQASKQTQKKPAADDTAIPETAKSQPTQSNNLVKNNSTQTLLYRNLSLNLLNLFQISLTRDDESDTQLTVKALHFLLNNINKNIESILISKIKRKTFLTKKEPAIYDSKKAEECAKSVSEVLPKIMDHLNFITTYLDSHISPDDQNETSFLYTSEINEYMSCLEGIYNMLTTYFKWIGFRNHHNALLKTSLRTLSTNTNVVVSLKDLLKAVAHDFQKHEKYCLQLSTAMALIDFLSALQIYSDNEHILKITKNVAQTFLSHQWKTPDGALEKGLLFNQAVDRLASIYFVNNEIITLKKISLQLTHDIKLLKTRADTLGSLKSINKGNFPVFYRNLGAALYDVTKARLSKGMTNNEHLELWKEVATILRHMSEIAKTLENRNNLSAFFKKSMPVLKLFLSQGIPILEIQFKNETQEVLEILKILQQSTRFLQSLCCHSRLKKDTVLISKVPFMRQLLETLIYKVKAVLAANNCSEAFWMGNLKNKNIHGEIIASQQSIESEETVEDGDEQLPDDDDSGDSDDEMLNPDSKSISDIV